MTYLKGRAIGITSSQLKKEIGTKAFYLTYKNIKSDGKFYPMSATILSVTEKSIIFDNGHIIPRSAIRQMAVYPKTTVVLMMSTTFPKMKGLSYAGTSTQFIEAIGEGSKKHTIRANYGYWLGKIKQVMNGEAVLSIRHWSGKPYSSKQVEAFRLTYLDGVGVQLLPSYFKETYSQQNLRILAKNDGLTLGQFREFFNAHTHEPKGGGYAIIHFTKLRY